MRTAMTHVFLLDFRQLSSTLCGSPAVANERTTSPMRRKLKVLLAALVLPLVATAVVLTAGPASAATPTRVPSFGNNPSNLNIDVYVPATVSARPAILVAVHYCTGSAQAFFNGGAHDFVTGADRYGYII